MVYQLNMEGVFSQDMKSKKIAQTQHEIRFMNVACLYPNGEMVILERRYKECT